MTNWAFVSDFDGTISQKDFYWIVIEKYFPEGEALYHKWQNGEMKDIDFLNTIFASIGQPEETIKQDIAGIPLDPHVKPFIEQIKKAGGDFIIISAGCEYYIHELLALAGIHDVPVYSNPGHVENGGLHLTPDPADRFYHERYGIDKKAVMQELGSRYDTLFFAGDSEPDSHPASLATVTYAMKKLPPILDRMGTPYEKADDFSDIASDLKKRGVLDRS
ncbi:MtnX-like HAD-IB family phosphatase [Alkalicoccus luteus]|uniref:MtnX-like HAD-IB family phosphatase n=1 Tax=Alkalicoccus luteus TaxID=1237094 RepID=UPI0040344556